MMLKYVLWYSIIGVICGGLIWILALTLRLKRRHRASLAQAAARHREAPDVMGRLADIFAQNKQATSAFRHAVEQYQQGFKRILIIDDEEATLFLFRKKFQYATTDAPVALFFANSGEEVIARTDLAQMDLFLIDLRLSGNRQGDDLIAWLAAQQVTAPIMVLSAWIDATMKQKLTTYPNVVAFLTKPIDFPTLFALIEQTLHIVLRK